MARTTVRMATKQTTFDGRNVDPHEDEIQCPTCDKWFQRLSQHWRKLPNHRPQFTDKQRQIIIGSLLGDGNYHTNKNTFMWQSMITRPYLEWLQNEFGAFANTIIHAHTPEEKATRDRKRNFNPHATAKNYSHYFTLQLRPHPKLKMCLDWGYTESGVDYHFPDDITLTPLILKIWYVSDGGLHYSNGKFQNIRIRVVSQGHRNEFIESLFHDIGFNVSVKNEHINILKRDVGAFLAYIGDPPTDSDAGFKYKWQYENYDEYQRLRKIMKSQPYMDDLN